MKGFWLEDFYNHSFCEEADADMSVAKRKDITPVESILLGIFFALFVVLGAWFLMAFNGHVTIESKILPPLIAGYVILVCLIGIIVSRVNFSPVKNGEGKDA